MSQDASTWAKDTAEKASRVFFQGKDKTPGEVCSRVDDLIRAVTQESARLVKANKEWDQKRINEELLKINNVKELSSEVKQAVHRFDKAYQIAKDERKQLAKIEHGQGFRRVIWRAASTASVAAVIIIAWAIAQKYGIHFPVMRLSG